MILGLESKFERFLVTQKEGADHNVLYAIAVVLPERRWRLDSAWGGRLNKSHETGCTSTRSPGFTPLFSKGNTIKQFASAMERSIPEPWAPVLRATVMRPVFVMFEYASR